MKNLWLVCCITMLSAAMLVSCGGNNGNTSSADNPAYQLPAVKQITADIEKSPENASLYYKRGKALHGLELDSLALNDFKKAISLDSSKAEYYSAVGDLMFEHKDIDGSLQWITKAIKLNPKDPGAHLKMAKLFIYTKDYTSAFAEINTVLRQDVYNPEGYFLKGVIYKELKDTTRAISSFHTAVQVQPSYRDAVIQLGLMYSMKKDPSALQYFENAFRLDSSDVFPIYAKGVFYQDMNDFKNAKEQYKQAILRNRDYPDAYFNMGYILLQEDSLDKAKRQFDIITQLEPNDPEAYYNRGLCNELLGKKEEAVRDYKQAIAFDNNYKEPQDGLKRLGAAGK